MTRPLVIRARVEARSEPPFDGLRDPLVEELVRGGAFARERFPTRWSDTSALKRLAESKRSPLPGPLLQELADYHRRLGATRTSLAALERMGCGEAVCAVAGQQPAPLGGPLYTLHKVASAVGLSGAIEARTGVPCVPMFWMHGEDSDFAEIRTATVGDSDLTLEELTLPDGAHREGGLVGAIPVEPVAALIAQAGRRWADLPSRSEAMAVLERSIAPARDLGEAFSALMLALFGDRGLVVVDPRLPAFRATARPIMDRYLGRAEELADRARRSGEELERRISRRPLSDAALESFVFAIEDGRRRKLSLSEARRVDDGLVLSPSVAIRPAIQDGVFPTVAMACGSSEVAYLAQLREIFEGLGVQAACPVPRLGATWLPPAAVAMIGASGASPWELVAGADAVLKRMAEQMIPPDARAELEQGRAQTIAALERFSEVARRVDPSLPQMVESARAKVDYQYERLLDGLIGKMRHRMDRQHPEWLRVRYYLMPGDRLQERRLSSLEPVAYRGIRVAGELCDLAREAADRQERGIHEHAVLEL